MRFHPISFSFLSSSILWRRKNSQAFLMCLLYEVSCSPSCMCKTTYGRVGALIDIAIKVFVISQSSYIYIYICLGFIIWPHRCSMVLMTLSRSLGVCHNHLNFQIQVNDLLCYTCIYGCMTQDNILVVQFGLCMIFTFQIVLRIHNYFPQFSNDTIRVHGSFRKPPMYTISTIMMLVFGRFCDKHYLLTNVLCCVGHLLNHKDHHFDQSSVHAQKFVVIKKIQ